MGIWSKEYMSIISKMEPFQKLNEETYMQRRNFKKVEVDGEEMLECESRIISKEEYERYISDENSPQHLENKENSLIIMAGIADTHENLENADENTLIIMQAIADLYETVAVLSDLHKEE